MCGWGGACTPAQHHQSWQRNGRCDVNNLEAMGWDGYWEGMFRAWSDAGPRQGSDAASQFVPARVVSVDRGSVAVRGNGIEARIPLGLPRNSEEDESWPPVVGDWMVVDDAAGSDVASISGILRRRGYLERPSTEQYGVAQPIAANVDAVGIVEPVFPAASVGRIERFEAIAHRAGISAVLILSKTDLLEPGEPAVPAELDTRGFAALVPWSSHLPQGLERIVDAIPDHGTIALLGRSGAGKSTLTNMLTGAGQATGSVRAGDGKGRHVTTARGLFFGNGRVIIDTPGVRAVAATAHRDDIDAVFPDIVELAGSCRFSNCTHAEEPGCAVRRALRDGALDPERFERYRRMLRESAFRAASDKRITRARERTSTKNNTRGRHAAMRHKGRGN